MIKLIEAVLGVFVQCDEREKYIGKITMLEKKYQEVLKKLIEGLLIKSKERESILSSSSSLKDFHNYDDINVLSNQIKELNEKIKNLEFNKESNNFKFQELNQENEELKLKEKDFLNIQNNYFEETKELKSKLLNINSIKNLDNDEEFHNLINKLKEKERLINEYKRKVENFNDLLIKNRELNEELEIFKGKFFNSNFKN